MTRLSFGVGRGRLVGMLPENPTIAMIGAGALGCYYGARLAQHGKQVHFLLRSDYAEVQKNGLTVRSVSGDFSLPPEAIHVFNDVRSMPKADLVIVTLKSTANDQFQPLIAPLLHDSTAILTLQNGLGNEERLAELFGAGRVMGGICFVCINRVGPGVIDHTAHGLIRLGEFGGGPSDRARWVADLFNTSAVQCEVLADLRYGRWEKLVWNIPFNGLSAAMDLTTDRLLDTPAGEELVRRVMSEVIATARVAGANLPDELIDYQIRRTQNMGSYRTSMHLDRTHGRALELEGIIGEPLRAAKRGGVPTPLMEAMYAQLRLLAQGNWVDSPRMA